MVKLLGKFFTGKSSTQLINIIKRAVFLRPAAVCVSPPSVIRWEKNQPEKVNKSE